ncbi:MAG TPA: glycosyltransferase [Bacteroidia bacterium]
MKILLLSNSASAHTQKWAKGLAAAGLQVGIFSLNRSDSVWYKDHKNIIILHEPEINSGNTKLTSKLGYLKNVKKLKQTIVSFAPDILHAHYATSYGMLGMRSKFKPFVISVWGSDVYDFPKKSPLHKLLLQNILSKSSVLCSTSISMKNETQKYINKAVEVIPFGIDAAYFKIEEAKREITTIGLVKSLEEKYGVDILIRAFDQVIKKYRDKQLSLLFVGDGSKRSEYENLAAELGIADKVTFTGKVPHDKIMEYHRSIDIFVSLSRLDSESFGVSLVEAMALEKPVVASDVSGFKEVLGSEPCGIIVKRNSVEEAANAIGMYIDNPELAQTNGKKARKRALELYNWDQNLKSMIHVYEQILEK